MPPKFSESNYKEMTLLFFILISIACLILGFFILVQNPKGGGLSGTFGGMNNQIMGVKQTTDVLEKGTWIFASVVGVFCIISVLFFNGTSTSNNNKLLKNLPTTAPASQQNSAPVNTVPATPKK